MKISIVEEKPVPPPKRVVLDLSEEEADLIRIFARYYAVLAHAGGELVAARRLSSKLASFNGKATYPYEKAFKDE